MKISKSIRQRGISLIEMSVAMTIGIAVAAIVLTLVNQQLAFLKFFYAQSFLTEEAPMIGMHVGRITGKADRFRLHPSLADALAGRNATLDKSPVLLMNFRQPDGSLRASILVCETIAGKRLLNYYVVPTSGVLTTPQWSITKRASDVSFEIVNGVLRMTLSGPQQEKITYSGTMQQ